MSVIGSLAAFDHWRQRVYLLESVPVLGLDAAGLDAAYDEAGERVEEAIVDLARPLAYTPVAPPEPGETLPDVRSSMPQGLYQQAVEVAKEHIRAGDIFQVILSQRFATPIPGLDPLAIYRALRVLNPSPYMFFIEAGDATLVGSSPERLVRLEEGRIDMRPLAGTRPRGRTEAEDRALAAALLADPKERAEHVMLVDLTRNDIGRVARYGSVEVSELMAVERYSHVMHLVSHVAGRLGPNHGPWDVLEAVFPHGTVSGAPKVRAMEIIDELERVPRGAYAGAVGYVGFDGSLNTGIAIRTVVARDAVAYVQAGAGVVYDSRPELEHQECLAKARGVLAALARAGGRDAAGH
jgi:anthranilate synthase component 1